MKKRSIVFYKNAYYYFYYLANALRKRGWDAINVSIDDPESKVYNFYHGEDINLFSSDPAQFENNIDAFYKEALERFDMAYFQGDHCLSFYPQYYNSIMPPDLVEWIRRGKKIGYIASGCLSGISRKSNQEWAQQGTTEPFCFKCAHLNNPQVCSEQRNLKWGRKFNALCDIVSAVYLPAIDYMAGSNVYYDPLDAAMDSNLWKPGLEIPYEHRIDREPGEILIFHAMANYKERTKEKVNIKGTSAVVHAVERLNSEGFKCRLVFKTGIPNYELRYYQAQADIIVEQLNVGRLGATSREGLMLGKPVVTYINKHEPMLEREHISLIDIPIVSASEETIYEELKELVQNSTKRDELAASARAYAMKWFDFDKCAERFEKVYDKVIETGRYENENFKSPVYADIKPAQDIYSYCRELAVKGELPGEVTKSLTTEDWFISIWGTYLEYAWLYRKVQFYIKKRIQEPLCEFGTHFEEALVKLELVQEPEALNEFHLSLQHFERRSEAFKEIDLSEYYYLISQTAARCNELNEAGILLSKAVQLNGEYTDALEQLAELLFMGGHIEKAKETMEQAYFSQPTRKSILSKLGEINLKLGLPENDMAKKESWLHQRIVLSEEYMEAGELNKARQILEALETLFPDTLDVLNNKAVLEVLCGNTESALADIHRVLQLDPENEQALENRKVLAGY